MLAINDNEELPNFKKTTLRALLKEIGFRYSKRKRNGMLKEKNEIAAWRRHYLREVRKLRAEGKQIYYLDEMWVNAGHTVQRIWQDTTITTARQPFLQGLSTGLKNPSGKGKRLIVLHIGSEKYAIDELATAVGRKILRLTPYHCELNSIELIWAQIKGEVARNNTNFKIQDVRNLLLTAVANVSSENWRKAISHTMVVEQGMWEADLAADIVNEPLIINLENESDSPTSSDSD